MEAGEDEFTLADVGGMPMAFAEKLSGASALQPSGMLMVAKSLMTALQDSVGGVVAGELARNLGPDARRSKTAKKTPGPKKKPGN